MACIPNQPLIQGIDYAYTLASGQRRNLYNGNILTLSRNGDSSHNAMDNLTYNYLYAKTGGGVGEYTPGAAPTTGVDHLTNQLSSINDAVGATSYYPNDIENQSAYNYQYDAIGNMVGDVQDTITSVTWSVYGKILTITKGSGTITYTYDASGNRISKSVGGITTWYVRDAQGNVMSVYTQGDATHNSGSLTQTEAHLYGSSRLGLLNLNVNCTNLVPSAEDSLIRGNKLFELSNHLGNVLATISDKKLQHTSDGSTVDYYNSDVIGANDYFSFGMQMPGRVYNNGSYRYGFNGQEKTDEINGSGNSYTAEFWEYDSRIGRRWNMDPAYKNSPYEAFGGNPILFSDPNGLDTISITRTKLIDHIKGQNSGGTSDVLHTPERTITRTNVDIDIKPSDGKDVFIFQENILSTDVNGNQTAIVGQPMTLNIDDLASTHPGIAQGQFPIMDGLFGLGTSDLNDRQAVAHFMDLDANFRSYMLGHNPEAQKMQNEGGSLAVMNGLMPAAVNGGMGLYIGLGLSTPSTNSSFYSVAYETKLSSSLYPGGSYYGHFKAANTMLDAAMTADKTFAAQMESLGIEIPKSPTGNILGKSPTGWTWHHSVEPGVLQLVPKYQHPDIPGGIFWDIMHPGGVGGMSTWNK